MLSFILITYQKLCDALSSWDIISNPHNITEVCADLLIQIINDAAGLKSKEKIQQSSLFEFAIEPMAAASLYNSWIVYNKLNIKDKDIL